MQVILDHPAIVGRRKTAADSPGHALVRIETQVKIAEYSEDDLPIAALVRIGSEKSTYRRIGDFYFKQLEPLGPDGISSNSSLIRRLIGSKRAQDFGSFTGIVKSEAEVLNAEMPGNVSYMRSKPTRDEARAGLSGLMKSFDKAPSLRMQSWIGASAESDRCVWAEKFRRFMENVILVGGIVHVRASEPCRVMSLRPPATRSMSLGRQYVLSVPAGAGCNYIVREGWDRLEETQFPLADLDLAAALASELGYTREWSDPERTGEIEYLDGALPATDFIPAECIRIAAFATGLADDVAEGIAAIGYARKRNADGILSRLDEINSALKSLSIAVNSPEDDIERIDAATKTLSSVLTARQDGLDPGTTRRIALLRDSISFLDMRRDMMPITIMPDRPVVCR